MKRFYCGIRNEEVPNYFSDMHRIVSRYNKVRKTKGTNITVTSTEKLLFLFYYEILNIPISLRDLSFLKKNSFFISSLDVKTSAIQ